MLFCQGDGEKKSPRPKSDKLNEELTDSEREAKAAAIMSRVMGGRKKIGKLTLTKMEDSIS